METFVVRVWLPDRPGALGAVATAVGAIGGEIVGIDILERGAGQAIDELAVDLPDADHLTALVRAVRSVDGAEVEEIRQADGGAHDPRADALELAAKLVGARTRPLLLDSLAEHGRLLLGAAWCVVASMDDDQVVAGDGPHPSPAWLLAFVEGSRSSALAVSGDHGPDDIVWAPLPASRLALVVGRDGALFRARERRHVASLARIADARLVEFVRRNHPSTGVRHSNAETA